MAALFVGNPPVLYDPTFTTLILYKIVVHADDEIRPHASPTSYFSAQSFFRILCEHFSLGCGHRLIAARRK